MTIGGSHLIVEDRLDISKIRPIQDLVLVEEIDRTKTSGGIFLAETGNRGTECRMARVLKVGNGIVCAKKPFFFPIELSPGDTVLTMEYAAEKLHVGIGKYRFVRSSFIWASVRLKNSESYEIDRLEPRFNSYLVQPDDEKMTMNGTLYIANEERKDSGCRLATIRAVGPGQWDSDVSTENDMIRRPMQFSVGERVLMTRFSGAEVEVEGKWMRLIQEWDIKCGYREEDGDERKGVA